jgi:hypothetical protein
VAESAREVLDRTSIADALVEDGMVRPDIVAQVQA